jgi:hypothetical protein
VALLVLAVSIWNTGTTSADVTSAEVKQGKFVVSLNVKGELRAPKSYILIARRPSCKPKAHGCSSNKPNACSSR